jgi:hypothetical protein
MIRQRLLRKLVRKLNDHILKKGDPFTLGDIILVMILEPRMIKIVIDEIIRFYTKR